MKIPFKPQLVIFDFDGTLVHHEWDHVFGEAERVLNELNHESVSREEMMHHFSLFDFVGFYRGANKREFGERLWQSINPDSFPVPRLFSGIEDLLNELNKRQIKCAVATARLQDGFCVDTYLKTVNVRHHFHYIGLRESDEVHWRDKAGTILRVCKQAGADIGRSIMVGDVPADIESAKKVGLGFTVAVRTGKIYDDVLKRAKPDALIDAATDILALLPG